MPNLRKIFIIPKYKEFESRPDFVNLLLDSIQFDKWRNGNGNYDIYSMESNNISTGLEQNIFPVGSLNFVNKIFLAQGYPAIRPINVPSELMSEEFCGRKIKNVNSTESIWLENYNKSIFIKSNTRTKACENGLLYNRSYLPQDKWQISEVLNDIVEEYRVIVFHGKIVHIAKYIGNDWTPRYNLKFIEDCINTWTNCPPAYTLDIGIRQNGQNIIIEAHNFISCGLYGFEQVDKFIPMTIQAVEYEHGLYYYNNVI